MGECTLCTKCMQVVEDAMGVTKKAWAYRSGDQKPMCAQCAAAGDPGNMSGAVAIKLDQGKIATHLLPFRALEEVAAVMAFGAKKYSDHNWRNGMNMSRLLGAGLRHLFAWARGVDLDEESGLSHLAHASFCVLALLECVLDGSGVDDRWKKAS